jgi:hypothetical protein
MEMDMQDSADMCAGMHKLDMLSRKRRWLEGAESEHLPILL